MITLRLFQRSDPAREIDSRDLAEGEVAVGRGRDVDWPIADPTKTLSRLHCVIALHDGAVTLRDASTNGVFLGDGDRIPKGAATPVAMGETIALGAFLIRVQPHRADEPRLNAGLDSGLPLAAPGATLPVVSAGSPAAGRLLDAFCGGAQIDSSVLSAEDPSEVMRRLGAIYRQMVLGLGELMNERTRGKARYGLEWTAVQALDNNPFRWAPPQRVAIDLLQARQEGFLTSEAAVRSSFDDLKDHQRRLAAGSQAAIEAMLAELAPEAVGESLKGQSFLMKKKSDALWAEYAAAHAKAREAFNAWTGGSAQAFREGYRKGAVEPAPTPPQIDLPDRPAQASKTAGRRT